MGFYRRVIREGSSWCNTTIAGSPSIEPEYSIEAASRNTQQEASFVQKTRWTLFDKSKADTLLKDLGWFIDGLYDLAPLWVEGTIRELKISISQLSSTIDSLVLLNAPTG